MRSLLLRASALILTVAIASWPQQTPTTAIGPTPVKDAQAVSVISQALAVAGGLPAITAITDYTESGTITYHKNQDIQGQVTISGLGLGQFRQDAILTTGTQSFAIDNGEASIKTEDGFVRKLNFNYQVSLLKSGRFLPCWQLAAALNDSLISLTYKGTSQLNGQSVIDVRVQRTQPGTPDPIGIVAEYRGADFFLDATSLQILLIQDIISPHRTRIIRYSDYRPTSGIMVPFLVDEEVDGQRTQTIQLTQINFNTGLQGSAFALQ